MYKRQETHRVAGTLDNTFVPAEVTISVGDPVVWEWEGLHNVSFGSGPRSGEPTTGGEWETDFAEAGTFDYVCEVHVNEGMTGSVIVTA